MHGNSVIVAWCVGMCFWLLLVCGIIGKGSKLFKLWANLPPHHGYVIALNLYLVFFTILGFLYIILLNYIIRL